MTTINGRILEICKSVGFTVGILTPIEIVRTATIGVSSIPLILFMASEYSITGETPTTELIANTLEFFGKKEIQQFANDNHIIGMKRIYSMLEPKFQ
jgi:hypothetical protein